MALRVGAVFNCFSAAASPLTHLAHSPLLAAVLVVAGTGIAACTGPRTDIVSTSTEDVGDFSMARVATPDTLQGQVCTADPRARDEIVARIVHQLAPQHYKSITLDVYSETGPVGRYVWSSGVGQWQGLPASPDPCGERRLH